MYTACSNRFVLGDRICVLLTAELVGPSAQKLEGVVGLQSRRSNMVEQRNVERDGVGGFEVMLRIGMLKIDDIAISRLRKANDIEWPIQTGVGSPRKRKKLQSDVR